MPVRAGDAKAQGLRNFDLSAELRATAERRKRPVVNAPDASSGGVADIARRLAEQIPSLPGDTIHALVSELFHSDSTLSRQQLADRSLTALVQLGVDSGAPQAVASFEPPVMEEVESQVSENQVFDEMLDSRLAELLMLPEDELLLCITTMCKMLSHIMEQPEEQKFRQVKKANHRFTAEVGRHDAALALLYLAGFVDEGEGEAAIIAFRGSLTSCKAFIRVQEAIEAASETLAAERSDRHRNSAGSVPISSPARTLSVPDNSVDQEQLAQSIKSDRSKGARRQYVATLTELRLRDPRSFQADAVRRRATMAPIPGVVPLQASATSPAPSAALTNRRSQHFTLADIERMRTQEAIDGTPNYAEDYKRMHQASPAGTYSTLIARSYDPELIARQALDGTNRYRGSKFLPPLRWHDGISRVAREHAEQMASGHAPFSHDGFDRRVASFKIWHRSAAENLALNSGVAEVATAAVNGWIKSPGHEKNLCGAFNLCGIGVAQAANGTFYLTQLFAQAF